MKEKQDIFLAQGYTNVQEWVWINNYDFLSNLIRVPFFFFLELNRDADLQSRLDSLVHAILDDDVDNNN
jgi:hypothetical protein